MLSMPAVISGQLLVGGSDPLSLPQTISFGVLPLELPTIDIPGGADGMPPTDGILTPIAPTGAPLPGLHNLGETQVISGAEVIGGGLRSVPIPLPGAGVMTMAGLAAVAGTSRRRRL